MFWTEKGTFWAENVPFGLKKECLGLKNVGFQRESEVMD